jgi:hypothetical protein
MENPSASPSLGLAVIGLPTNVTDPLLIDDTNARSIAAQLSAFPVNGSLFCSKLHSTSATVRRFPQIFGTTGFTKRG